MKGLGGHALKFVGHGGGLRLPDRERVAADWRT